MGCFKIGNPGDGAGCDCCTGIVTVHVVDPCTGAPVNGATVTISKTGTTTQTGTTNTSGNATFTLTSSGSYTVAVTGITGFVPYSATFTFSCANLTVNVTLTLSPGYVCAATCCLDNTPVSNAITITYGGATVSTFIAHPTFMTLTVNNVLDCRAASPCGAVFATGQIQVNVNILGCNAGSFRATITMPGSSNSLDSGCASIEGLTGTVGGVSVSSSCSHGTSAGSGVDLGEYTVTLSGTCSNGIINVSGTVPSTSPSGLSIPGGPILVSN